MSLIDARVIPKGTTFSSTWTTMPIHLNLLLLEDSVTDAELMLDVLREAGFELASRRVGEFVMAELRKLDHVAYVRFASVYRAFEDVADFREELDRLERDTPDDGQMTLLDGDPPTSGKPRRR